MIPDETAELPAACDLVDPSVSSGEQRPSAADEIPTVEKPKKTSAVKAENSRVLPTTSSEFIDLRRCYWGLIRPPWPVSVCCLPSLLNCCAQQRPDFARPFEPAWRGLNGTLRSGLFS